MIPDLIAYILVEAGKLGGVTVRQVYGNWAAPSMQSWKKQLAHYGLEPMGNRAGPNATDIALVIGAMDLLYQGIKHFCLVAGDSDYVPLVQRLRQEGCTVLVIGTPAVSHALKNASSLFLSTDQLLPPTASASHPLPSSPSPAETVLQAPALSILLTEAYQIAAHQCESEWVLLSALGLALRQHSPTFEQAYGKKSLSALVQQCSECLEIRKSERGKGLVEEVRLRSRPQG
jgi:uncharacterized protein (TIGR00288 family)